MSKYNSTREALDQHESNKLWHCTAASNIGEITLLQPPVVGVAGLKKPYQYVLSLASTNKLISDLNKGLRKFRKQLQCDLIDIKAITYGVRLHIFLLGYRPGLVLLNGNPKGGITETQWVGVTDLLRARLQRALGADAMVYIEPWSANKKFQARFETYIKYK